jgi:uncharacterized membrane protein YkvA (DUF1232 family)
MRDFDELIAEEIEHYTGRHENLIVEAPAFFRLLDHLLDDPNLPGKLRPLVLSAIAYYVLATDIIPEDLKGPYGYIDDIFLSAFVANYVRRESKSDDILLRNWDGKATLLPLIEGILANERSLIGDHRELILWYIGFEYLR